MRLGLLDRVGRWLIHHHLRFSRRIIELARAQVRGGGTQVSDRAVGAYREHVSVGVERNVVSLVARRGPAQMQPQVGHRRLVVRQGPIRVQRSLPVVRTRTSHRGAIVLDELDALLRIDAVRVGHRTCIGSRYADVAKRLESLAIGLRDRCGLEFGYRRRVVDQSLAERDDEIGLLHREVVPLC